MRIISKFSDYYDCMMHQIGMDKRIVYMRKTVSLAGYTHELSKAPCHKFRMIGDDWQGSSPTGAFHYDGKYITTIVPMLAGVAGNTYPGIYIMYVNDNLKHYGYIDEKEDYLWDKDEIEKLLMAHIKWYDGKFRSLRSWISNGEINLVKDFLKFKFDEKMYHEMNAPILFYWGGTRGRGEFWHSNVELRVYKFMKKMDVYTIFQEIQSYVSGVLQSHENNTVEVSNQSKIDGHGYDKWSFRKHKDDPKVPETKKQKRKRNEK